MNMASSLPSLSASTAADPVSGTSVALSGLIDAGCGEDARGDDAFRPYPNAFALELSEVVQSLRATIENPKDLVVDAPQ